VVKDLEPVSPQAVDVRSIARMKSFVDPMGVTWHRRGDHPLEGKAVARRLRDPDLLVAHEYEEALNVIGVQDRDAFWAHAEETMRTSGQSHFYGVEFKNGAHQYLLIVHEDC
jgi:hypothetical protein